MIRLPLDMLSGDLGEAGAARVRHFVSAHIRPGVGAQYFDRGGNLSFSSCGCGKPPSVCACSIGKIAA